MDRTSDVYFGHMRDLFKEWLSRARLIEIVAVVILAKRELGCRGITLTYAINQTGSPPDSTQPRESRG